MSPQNRPHSITDRLAAPVPSPCPARAAALDLLHDFALPDACNVEFWLDRIEARTSREIRP
ncbi:MAG: hypothetical protein QUV10_14175 [Paracoccaceae bacterium]|jgi:hypothetical protein|uniref:hypothetical protein n=1 Tax=unclassified Seohaeicola TaxID=2641111 RepID=UPI00237A92A2|nr:MULTISPECIES: hypothetical protein [unclassified Seohaeicola]MDD9708364.1 hypothetical protein [Seohaeicola sp. 4SK31]MDD9736481.1 hypothetical protein [Seohaeicola sp. SP36]MDF1707094.1 hypothetical protein [Paracoccaceae bacterium]MDM7970759.1 hypothetical protein [Paracoccaceae bacterium]